MYALVQPNSNSADRSCVQCPTNCEVCSDATNCTTCMIGFSKKADNTCGNSPSDLVSSSSINGFTILCPVGCATCITAT